jgi:hypothetical protein
MARNTTGAINLLPTNGSRAQIYAFIFRRSCIPLGGPCRGGTLPHQHPGAMRATLASPQGPVNPVIGHSQASPETEVCEPMNSQSLLILISRQARWVNLPDGALALIAPNSICTGVLALRPNLSCWIYKSY